MLEILLEWDKALFLWLNGLHTDWMDPVMFWISDKKIWIPFYLLIAGWIIREYKWKGIIVLLGIGLAITATDQTCSGFMKPFFERFRPSRNPALEGLVHVVNDYRGGSFGFSSSHAGNTFSLATFLFFIFRNKYPWFSWMFLWAAIVSYSRIYLGVHYPGDILVGAAIGTIYGYLAYRLTCYSLVKFAKK
ncbi:phosphatase PAP2 family protein [Fulvivirga sp. M361]|uniref:phosphatase PAP2 family protein n=1 Tax=Fulvivirga sp. M361 TaxID=2594266 RepID=UPI00117A4384|nr:phosphatase PAP2 family protein [Fulvivirga sp. M361]TRX52395.1 phosphatase PAP2 family protein [Fulvivirga sp. M361]